ncbi:alpha-keto acid decarboxylase family protein [Providencia sneebia]|uniref:Indolepyruvate decarboxylase n=1 Tax=Providencia sneebia DSM 19967 TaxID=1141660 RepID=K8WTI0_9GAMM|nr:alpha-keto acid decarboxylase family protein [Providencia sneebia]EKT59500.1 indolepyruvate decarboxylase [Providencia sneebia DSM 19967]
MNKNYTVADYLLDRLAQIGIRHLFGVPGDYNLQFLDHIISHPQIDWIGCANELNASYTADGYARCKPAAAILTTFGVGELSAINGIAGAYAEYLPIIHIVGAPVLKSQQAGLLLHHSLGDGDFDTFSRMAKEVSVAQACLTPENAESEIDRLIITAMREHRPVHLVLPCDVATMPLVSKPAPLILPQSILSTASLDMFIEAAKNKLINAKKVSVLAGCLAERLNVQLDLKKWMDEVPLPHSTLLFGKGVFDEDHANFIGTYIGAASSPEIKQQVEDVDVTINIGVIFVDTTTTGFSHHLPIENCIYIHPNEARVGHQVFTQIPMQDAINALHQLTISLASQWQLPKISKPLLPEVSSTELNQSYFWSEIQKFIRPNDILFTDQGTSCFGAAALDLPENCKFVVQSLWASVGFSLAATFGAQLAVPNRRVILLIGDGSAQFTVQELGTMLRNGIKPIIFLLNNQGYTVERAIHGPEELYNDITLWDWTLLFKGLANEHNAFIRHISEPKQLRQALEDVVHCNQLAFMEVILPKMDTPKILDAISLALKKSNTVE